MTNTQTDEITANWNKCIYQSYGGADARQEKWYGQVLNEIGFGA